MARKKAPRRLATLPGRRALERAHHKTEALIEILRGVAVKNQREQPQAFYSMREVAAHFRVQVSTVSRVYQRLEKEGLLSRVRGSKTVLQGLHFDRQLSVRAFVGLPASLPSFVTLQDYRTFLIRLRRELRLRGFAAATAYFERNEAGTGALSARLKTYEVDTVIWFQPPKEAKETALASFRHGDSSDWSGERSLSEHPLPLSDPQRRRDEGVAGGLEGTQRRRASHPGPVEGPAVSGDGGDLASAAGGTGDRNGPSRSMAGSGARRSCALSKKRKQVESFFPLPCWPPSSAFVLRRRLPSY